MNEHSDPERDAYYREAQSWAADRERSRSLLERTSWVIAAVATTIALFEAIALIALTPLKTVVPYTLLVDRQTGFVQALKPLDREMVAPDAALTRSLLAQYVIAREGFDISSVRDDYRRVALWSGGQERDRYVAIMRASNPSSPLVTLPKQTVIQAEVRSISPLGTDAALVRFVTDRTDPGSRATTPFPWVAVIKYGFSNSAMSAADRLANPLGFQVMAYRRDAEIPIPAPPEAAPPAPPIGQSLLTLRSGANDVVRDQP